MEVILIMKHTYRKSSFARRRAKLRRYRFILFVILIAVSVISIWHCFQKLSELISLAETAHAQTGAENSPTLFSILQEGKDDSNSSSSNLPYYSADEAYRIALDGLSQDGIPTGCESVSTVCVLQYWGIDITPDTFIQNYLPCESFLVKGETIYGPDPNESFAGDPYTSGSLGCFSNVIIKALDAMKADGYAGIRDFQFLNIRDQSLASLADTYVTRGIPVIVWATMNMQPSYDGMEYYLKDGSLFTWTAREHCMVLCGFSDSSFYLMDPMADGEIVAYDKDVSETRFDELEQQVVVLVKKKIESPTH